MKISPKWKIEDVLSLTFFKKVNLRHIKKAVEKFDGMGELLDKNNDSQLSLKFKQENLFDDNLEKIKEKAGEQLKLCDERDVRVVSYWDESYPELLREISVPPIILFVKGELQKSDAASISIVGTRRCQNYGKMITEKFSKFLAENGVIITSGLAQGIDTISHLSAIDAGGITYAVLGSGLDCISSYYSRKNADKIVESGGAIISEYACGVTAKPGYFPQRNRIISGISKATIVIESGEKGGSLITANFAVDQNRELFAVPGDIRSKKSFGTNLLIKRNLAVPALSPKQVLEDLGFSSMYEFKSEERKIELPDDEKRVYETLSFEPAHIDAVAEKLEMGVAEISVKLLNLEFKGLVRQLPGKHYIKNE